MRIETARFRFKPLMNEVEYYFIQTGLSFLRLLPELRQKLGWQAQRCLLAGGHWAASSLFAQSAPVFRSGALFFKVVSLIWVAPFFLRVF